MIRLSRLAGMASLVALLGWAAWESRWQPQPEPAPAVSDATVAATPATPLRFAPLSDYPVTLERPLFFPGRVLPTGTAAVTAADDEDAPPPVIGGAARPSLKAVIIDKGQRSALLQLPGQPDSVRLRAGESAGGWRLVAIGDDEVTIESGGKREQLPLRDFSHAPAPRPQPPRPGMHMRSGINPATEPE